MISALPDYRPLLLDDVGRRTRPEWLRIVAGTLAVHLLALLVAVRLPSFVPRAQIPERKHYKEVKLYLPRDFLTQKAPSQQQPNRSFDLADLTAPPSRQSSESRPRRAARQFEMPRQNTRKAAPPAQPQPKTEPPAIAANEPPAASPLTTNPDSAQPSAPPPAPQQPEEPQPKVQPRLAPPKATVDAAIQGLARRQEGGQITVNDDTIAPSAPGSTSSKEINGGLHPTVELKSDPQGADMKPYLVRILRIVRQNWNIVIPESARLGTRRGCSIVQFAIDRDGSIPKLVISDPSGSEALDRAAVAGLSMSNPLPQLPTDYKGLQVRLAFSFSYNLPKGACGN